MHNLYTTFKKKCQYGFNEYRAWHRLKIRLLVESTARSCRQSDWQAPFLNSSVSTWNHNCWWFSFSSFIRQCYSMLFNMVKLWNYMKLLSIYSWWFIKTQAVTRHLLAARWLLSSNVMIWLLKHQQLRLLWVFDTPPKFHQPSWFRWGFQTLDHTKTASWEWERLSVFQTLFPQK